jgi:hypothetical protein
MRCVCVGGGVIGKLGERGVCMWVGGSGWGVGGMHNSTGLENKREV